MTTLATGDDPDLVLDQVTAGAPSLGVQVTESIWQTRVRYVVLFGLAIATPFLYAPSGPLVTLFVVSYLIRMWGCEAVYHRYFSHRSYSVSRTGQFILAVIGAQCAQHGPLWWAAIHRVHHRNVETDADPISPRTQGRVHSHVGWVWQERYKDTQLDVVRDFVRYPEILWVNKHYTVLGLGGGLVLALLGWLGWLGPGIDGWSAFLYGFAAPVAVGVQTVSLVNSIGHMRDVPGGYRRYDTPDDSMNRPLLALITLGGGWHNNHHRYAATARAGFAWYEIDVTYYVLKALHVVGFVKTIRDKLPEDVRREGGLPPGPSTIVADAGEVLVRPLDGDSLNTEKPAGPTRRSS
jgi:stearoyl-CoA desaturase (delta-9 desaturase)